MNHNIGILLTQIGTPSAPTVPAVRRYLKQFLSDRRIIDIHPLLWQPLLHGIILRTRPKQSSMLYQKIWTEAGSPLLVYSERLKQQLQNVLGESFSVALGMHYGEPSIENALEDLKKCDTLIVLPLYPQYSGASTASSFDRVVNRLKTRRKLPTLHFLKEYADAPLYIKALAQSIQKASVTGHILFSFHGIPERYANQGDHYPERCRLTARLVAEELKLNPDQWSLSFQSRLGPAKWLAPYTDHVLQQLPTRGITNLSVICPGFSVDCLETLEEIALRGKEQFLIAGGHTFNYIPALNDTQPQIELLKQLIQIYV